MPIDQSDRNRIAEYVRLEVLQIAMRAADKLGGSVLDLEQRFLIALVGMRLLYVAAGANDQTVESLVHELSDNYRSLFAPEHTS